MLQVFHLFSALFFLIYTAADVNAQSSPYPCNGEVPRPIRNAPYDLLLNTWVEQKAEYKMVHTCVQNNTSGRIEFSWPAAGHYGAFKGRNADDNSRPLPDNAKISLVPGCFFYGLGRDSNADVGYFFE